MTGLIKHYKLNGLTPKEKLSGGRSQNTNSFKYEDIKITVTFISNYAAQHALVLPGRVPGFKKEDVKLLPSSETKIKVYNSNVSAISDAGTFSSEIII